MKKTMTFLFVGQTPDGQPQNLPLAYANRHGLIAGATGTGKTVTLQVLAEAFSKAGVPVFATDIKGDLSGLSLAGQESDSLKSRLQQRGLPVPEFRPTPSIFWDIFGEKGHPLRATVSDMGALLLSRLLNASEAQEGVLSIAFRIADAEGLLLLDLKDLRSVLTYVADNADEFSKQYGHITSQSVASVQRALLQLEDQGANSFFGEPALTITDFLKITPDGQGYVHLLAADQLMSSPKIYATFLLWMLSELYETLPEVGDLEKPKLVLFFDEAHLLFQDAPKVLLEKIEQVVRLIRSKGVGVYLITQNPMDIPDTVLGQLGHRVQHALRAFTPKDQKALKVAAETFRSNPDFKTEELLPQLAVGEALTSFLEKDGVPGVVQRTFIAAPTGQIGAINDDDRRSILQKSLFYQTYTQMVDRDSAYERLQSRADAQHQDQRDAIPERQTLSSSERRGDSLMTVALKSAVRAASSRAGREIIRGLLGSFSKRF
jgi:DNA helicase HerA-like ATPase